MSDESTASGREEHSLQVWADAFGMSTDDVVAVVQHTGVQPWADWFGVSPEEFESAIRA
jgi:hypothetical protein